MAGGACLGGARLGLARQAWRIKGPYVPRRRCLAAAAVGALGIGYLTGRKLGRAIAERFDRRT